MALLGRLLPFMVARHVPEADNYWANYLRLLRVVDLLMAPEISADEVAVLDMLIREHHETFVHLYPEESVTPKLALHGAYASPYHEVSSVELYLDCVH